jgi:hypothetical protein
MFVAGCGRVGMGAEGGRDRRMMPYVSAGVE